MAGDPGAPLGPGADVAQRERGGEGGDRGGEDLAINIAK